MITFFYRFKPMSEVHRIYDTVKGNRRFEPEMFNANRLAQPDQFRIEQRNTKDRWMTDKPFFCNTSKAASIPALEPHQTQSQTRTHYNRSIQGSNRKEVGMGSELGGAFPSIEDINLAVNTQSRFYEPYNKVQALGQARGGAAGMK